MWCNDDDFRERAAYVCLNKSQLNQYCTALAMRTLGSCICYVEVEETELGVVRTGGTGVFVISCVHVHRCRIKNIDVAVCVHECGHICQVSEVHSCKAEKCVVLVEWTWLKTDVWDTAASGATRVLPAFQAQVVKYCPDLTTRSSEVHNHLNTFNNRIIFI